MNLSLTALIGIVQASNHYYSVSDMAVPSTHEDGFYTVKPIPLPVYPEPVTPIVAGLDADRIQQALSTLKDPFARNQPFTNADLFAGGMEDKSYEQYLIKRIYISRPMFDELIKMNDEMGDICTHGFIEWIAYVNENFAEDFQSSPPQVSAWYNTFMLPHAGDSIATGMFVSVQFGDFVTLVRPVGHIVDQLLERIRDEVIVD
jgi:hypothetical protein